MTTFSRAPIYLAILIQLVGVLAARDVAISPSPQAASPSAAGGDLPGTDNTGNFTRKPNQRLGLYFSLNYGRWCGPNNGGYTNCCSGRPCSSCGTGVLANSQTTASSACLAQCAPQDALDRICATHDTCLKQQSMEAAKSVAPRECGPNSFGQNFNNSCFCDKAALDAVAALTTAQCPGGPLVAGSCGAYRSNFLDAFRSQVPCWAYSGSSKTCYTSSMATIPAGSPGGVWAVVPYSAPLPQPINGCYISNTCNNACPSGTQCQDTSWGSSPCWWSGCGKCYGVGSGSAGWNKFSCERISPPPPRPPPPRPRTCCCRAWWCAGLCCSSYTCAC